MKRYQWMVIQEGTLALRPNGEIIHSVEHRPTSAVIWPENERPARQNTILTDPYFTANSFQMGEAALRRVGITFEDIGHIFITHGHFDHMPRFPGRRLTFERFESGYRPELAEISTVPCPGHADDLRALVFTSPNHEQVWVVADAVLDEDWLRAWRYYWPNGYSPAEIMQTWRSAAAVLAQADVIVPGHGAAIRVTAKLVEDLIAAFPQAEYAAHSPDVTKILYERARKLRTSS